MTTERPHILTLCDLPGIDGNAVKAREIDHLLSSRKGIYQSASACTNAKDSTETYSSVFLVLKKSHQKSRPTQVNASAYAKKVQTHIYSIFI